MPPLSGAPVPEFTPQKRERRVRMDEYFTPGKRMPLPKGKELVREYLRLERNAQIAWEELAKAKASHEVDKRRAYARIDRLTEAQEFMRQEFVALREEVKKLTQALKK